MRPAALLFLAGALAGCAAAPTDAPTDAARKVPPIGAYSSNPFVPINLYLNANEQLPPQQAALVEYAAERLRESNAFVRVDRGVQRWPITVQASYRVASAAGGARRALGWLTLGLVPVRVARVHTLVAEIFEEPESIAALELSFTASERVSLYDGADADGGGRAAVDALLERMLAEVATRKLIPRWSAFKPEAPKKKPKVPGRAT